MSKIIMTIDPGLDGTGFAIWDAGKNAWRNAKLPPVEVGVLDIPAEVGMDLVERCRWLGYQLSSWATPDLACAFIERPRFFQSAKGLMVARKGDLEKLCMLVGCIIGELEPRPVELVPIEEWKGQLPKDVVTARIRKRYGDAECKRLGIKTHAWDAVGIGMHLKDKARNESEAENKANPRVTIRSKRQPNHGNTD